MNTLAILDAGTVQSGDYVHVTNFQGTRWRDLLRYWTYWRWGWTAFLWSYEIDRYEVDHVTNETTLTLSRKLPPLYEEDE